MVDIFWTSYQENHITKRHSVTLTDFEEAWLDREDGPELAHENGPYYESYGFTNSYRCLIMIWRWQDDGVWPITAYFEEE